MVLDARDLGIMREIICRIREVRKKRVVDIEDIFSEDARLIISPNNRCGGGCLHCVADSTLSGEEMSYSDFVKIPKDFFDMFGVVDFGRRGNPLIYNSGGNDLVDVMDFLAGQGKNEFTIASAIQRSYLPVIGRLEEFASKGNSVGTMVTYHHYFNNLNTDRLAEDINRSLKNFFKFSNEIVISLLGDRFSSQPKENEVVETFQNNWDKIFRGIEVGDSEGGKYQAVYMGKVLRISIPLVSGAVYPLGRFRGHLVVQGELGEYSRKFEESMGEYVCPDLVKWPGIIIEPNGDLNLCGSFEAICCNGAIVSNLFDRSYDLVKKDLLDYYSAENKWVLNNLEGLVSGKISGCRLKRKITLQI